MEQLFILLLLLVCFNFVLKQTFVSVRAMLFTTVAVCSFTYAMWPYAIEQSSTQIATWLATPTLMRDLAVVLSLDVLVQAAFCMRLAHNGARPAHKGRWQRYVDVFLRCYPGLFIFPAAFSLLTASIFAFPGVDFTLVAAGVSGTLLMLLIAASFGLRRMLIDRDTRLELLFLTNVLVSLIGIIVTVNGTTAAASIDNVDWRASLLVLSIAAGGSIVGYLLRRLKIKYDHHKLTRK